MYDVDASLGEQRWCKCWCNCKSSAAGAAGAPCPLTHCPLLLTRLPTWPPARLPILPVLLTPLARTPTCYTFVLPHMCLQGLRILEYACDHAAEHTGQALAIWALLEKEVKVGGWQVFGGLH